MALEADLGTPSSSLDRQACAYELVLLKAVESRRNPSGKWDNVETFELRLPLDSNIAVSNRATDRVHFDRSEEPR